MSYSVTVLTLCTPSEKTPEVGNTIVLGQGIQGLSSQSTRKLVWQPVPLTSHNQKSGIYMHVVPQAPLLVLVIWELIGGEYLWHGFPKTHQEQQLAESRT